MNDKQSWHIDWLSDMLKSELLISEKELLANLDKSEHSFLRNLLNDPEVNDKYELEGIQRRDTDVFDHTAVSTQLSQIANNFADSTDVSEQSDAQVACTESETVIKPPRLVEKGSKCGRLRCQISRVNSISDRSFADDSADSLLKTPAGFYDRSCPSYCLSIPPLFDYSSSFFASACHPSSAACSFSSTDNLSLCGIVEDEKWSEGSEILSVDVDSSSTSALSPVDFSSEDGTPSIVDDEEKLSEQEERVVLSVVQNVLSDEAVSLGLDNSVNDESCHDEPQHSPEIPSSETSVVVQSSRSVTTDMSRLNPLARPFSCVPKIPVQPVPIVFTPSMPTVVVPVKLAYTSLVPVATSKSASLKRPEKNNVHQHTGTLALSSSAAPNSE